MLVEDILRSARRSAVLDEYVNVPVMEGGKHKVLRIKTSLYMKILQMAGPVGQAAPGDYMKRQKPTT